MKYLQKAGLSCLLFLSGFLTGLGQDTGRVVPLWPDGAPGFERLRNEPEEAKDYWVRHINNPSLTVFLPAREKANGTAVLICPGGGHRELVYNAEGREPALYLNSLGIAAFVLKYRLFREPNSPYSLEDVRKDVSRAMRAIRNRAREWGIDTGRVGMLGFSAGGEVVSLIAYSHGRGDPQSIDPIDRQNAKPDFQMLIYPGPYGIPDQVPPDAPPAFLVVAENDSCCSAPTLNLLMKYREARLPVEAHIFTQGGHGFNMGYRSSLQAVKNWPQRMADWLADSQLLKPRPIPRVNP
jgi:acetyl esterase/lipase